LKCERGNCGRAERKGVANEMEKETERRDREGQKEGEKAYKRKLFELRNEGGKIVGEQTERN